MKKDATSTSVHQRTAIGNDQDRKKREMDRQIASDTSSSEQDQGKIDESKDGNKGKDDIVTAKFDKAQVVKVDESLGLVFGYAIVSKVDGDDYVDLQGDHIPEQAMLEAATDFMQNSRVAKDMHDGEPNGSVVFAYPMTTEIAKALDISVKQTGLLIAMKPSADVLAKFKAGEYTGFSIGGERVTDERVD